MKRLLQCCCPKVGNESTKTNQNSRNAQIINFEPMKFNNKNIDVIDILAGKKITKRHLVVDDAESNRRVVKLYLERKDITVEEAANGAEALELLLGKNDLEYFDTIWVDIKMPVMNGHEFTEKARQEGYQKLIIGVTGNIQENYQKICYEKGMNDIIAKPIVKDLFFQHILFEFYKSIEQ